MMRFSVRVAFGLMVTLSASSFAAAQVVRGDVTSARDRQPLRAFRQISFGATTSAPQLKLAPQPDAMPRINPTPQPDAGPRPDAASRMKAAPSCVMRVVLVDPRVTSGMPIVTVDERADPKSVVKLPACQPRD